MRRQVRHIAQAVCPAKTLTSLVVLPRRAGEGQGAPLPPRGTPGRIGARVRTDDFRPRIPARAMPPQSGSAGEDREAPGL
ncbi:hypothetical protein [Salipiger abyssi]|uniref:hypothetical protein n=1 Tax=Salipiger abyssi TaxID=1250539 RepID=UPI001A8D653A|nr:hypothetical protein [Salipiger abyssi]MBN9887860.1 hypothetical protein [Salipiger abyssi]